MAQSRRDFLATAAAVGVGARLTSAAQPKLRMRKDISTLDADSADIKALSEAVKIMREKPPIPNLSWATQAAIHGSQDPDSFNKCQHINWFFAPWHRMYLYFFEKIVAKLSGYEDFALPYWDWSRNPTVPDLFWNAPLLDVTRGVKKGQAIGRQEFNTFVSLRVVNDIVDIADFGTFGGSAGRSGQLEGTPHNFIHRWVRGDMVTGASPLDPVFWLHHCNIDRLYAVWIRRHPDRLPGNGWEDREFKDFYAADGTAGVGLKVKDTSDTTALGYTYSRVTPVFGAAQLPELRPIEGPSAKPEIDERAAIYTIAPRARVAAGVRATVGRQVDPRNSTIRLELTGVKVPKNQDVRVSVFVNARKPDPNLPITDPHYVTSFTFFQAPHGAGKKDDHKDESTISLAADATRTLIRLYGDGAFGESEMLKVQVVAAPLFPDRADGWKGTVRELAPAEVQLVIVGPKE